MFDYSIAKCQMTTNHICKLPRLYWYTNVLTELYVSWHVLTEFAVAQ